MAQREVDNYIRGVIDHYRVEYGDLKPFSGVNEGKAVYQAYANYMSEVEESVGQLTLDIASRATQMFNDDVEKIFAREGVENPSDEKQEQNREAQQMLYDRIDRDFGQYVLPISQRYNVPIDDLFHMWRGMVGDQNDTEGIRMFAQYIEHQLQQQEHTPNQSTTDD